MRPAPRPARAATLVVGLALGAGIAFSRHDRGSAVDAPGSVAVWVADRDGDEVVGLDARLLRVTALRVAAPERVRATADGGAWIVSGADRLIRSRADGALVAAAAVPGPVLDLAPWEGGVALLVHPPGEVLRLLRAGPRGDVLEAASVPGAVALAGAPDAVDVLDEAGGVRSFALRGGLVLRAVHASSPGPARQRTDPDGSDGRDGPDGATARAWAHGSAVSIRWRSGAVLLVDERGRLVRAQGGFEGISDLAPLPPLSRRPIARGGAPR